VTWVVGQLNRNSPKFLIHSYEDRSLIGRVVMGPPRYLLGLGTTRWEQAMSLQAARFSPPKLDKTVSTATWSCGLTLLGLAVAVIMLGAVLPEIFDPGLNQSGLGLP
jgi:hypothetical protein